MNPIQEVPFPSFCLFFVFSPSLYTTFTLYFLQSYRLYYSYFVGFILYLLIKAMFVAAVEGSPAPFDDASKRSPEFANFMATCLKSNPNDRPLVGTLLQHPFLQKSASKEEMKSIMAKIFAPENRFEDSMDVDDD